jgi:hypothetical protein
MLQLTTKTLPQKFQNSPHPKIKFFTAIKNYLNLTKLYILTTQLIRQELNKALSQKAKRFHQHQSTPLDRTKHSSTNRHRQNKQFIYFRHLTRTNKNWIAHLILQIT